MFFSLNSCSFSSSATSSNAFGKSIIHTCLTSLNSFTHSTRLRFWGVKMMSLRPWLRLTQPTQTASPIHDIRHTKYLSTLICCPWAYNSSLAQLYPLLPHGKSPVTQLQLAKTSSAIINLILFNRLTLKAQINSTPLSHSGPPLVICPSLQRL